jgi:hypothetical protein
MNEYITSTGGELIQTISEPITEGFEALGSISLDFVRGLGGAIIDGIDNGYDAIAAKLSGKESAVISGMTVAVIGILTLVFLFNAAKSGKV